MPTDTTTERGHNPTKGNSAQVELQHVADPRGHSVADYNTTGPRLRTQPTPNKHSTDLPLVGVPSGSFPPNTLANSDSTGNLPMESGHRMGLGPIQSPLVPFGYGQQLVLPFVPNLPREVPHQEFHLVTFDRGLLSIPTGTRIKPRGWAPLSYTDTQMRVGADPNTSDSSSGASLSKPWHLAIPTERPHSATTKAH